MDSKKWLECVAATWAEGYRTGPELGRALAKKLALPSVQMGEALVGAMDELMGYAAGAVGEENVLELEDVAVARSRAVMRGLLEAKLQKRVDTLDAGEKKKPVANVTNRPSRKVGAGEAGKAS